MDASRVILAKMGKVSIQEDPNRNYNKPAFEVVKKCTGCFQVSNSGKVKKKGYKTFFGNIFEEKVLIAKKYSKNLAKKLESNRSTTPSIFRGKINKTIVEKCNKVLEILTKI